MAIIRNLTVSDIAIDDLSGITILAASDYDLSEKSSKDIANSVNLNTLISAGSIVFIDGSGTSLTLQESLDTQSNISSTQPAIIIQSNGVNVAGTPHNVFNFINSNASVVDGGNGVADISTFPGLDFNTIGGQEILTLVDASRSNKKLSVEKINFLFSKSGVSDGTTLAINGISDSSVGYVIPFNATIVGITTHKIDGDDGIMNYDLLVNDTLRISAISSTLDGGEEKIQSNNINVDVLANDKIAIVGESSDGNITHDGVSLVLYIRWRV